MFPDQQSYGDDDPGHEYDQFEDEDFEDDCEDDFDDDADSFGDDGVFGNLDPAAVEQFRMMIAASKEGATDSSNLSDMFQNLGGLETPDNFGVVDNGFSSVSTYGSGQGMVPSYSDNDLGGYDQMPSSMGPSDHMPSYGGEDCNVPFGSGDDYNDDDDDSEDYDDDDYDNEDNRGGQNFEVSFQQEVHDHMKRSVRGLSAEASIDQEPISMAHGFGEPDDESEYSAEGEDSDEGTEGGFEEENSSFNESKSEASQMVSTYIPCDEQILSKKEVDKKPVLIKHIPTTRAGKMMASMSSAELSKLIHERYTYSPTATEPCTVPDEFANWTASNFRSYYAGEKFTPPTVGPGELFSLLWRGDRISTMIYIKKILDTKGLPIGTDMEMIEALLVHMQNQQASGGGARLYDDIQDDDDDDVCDDDEEDEDDYYSSGGDQINLNMSQNPCGDGGGSGGGGDPTDQILQGLQGLQSLLEHPAALATITSNNDGDKTGLNRKSVPGSDGSGIRKSDIESTSTKTPNPSLIGPDSSSSSSSSIHEKNATCFSSLSDLPSATELMRDSDTDHNALAEQHQQQHLHHLQRHLQQPEIDHTGRGGNGFLLGGPVPLLMETPGYGWSSLVGHENAKNALKNLFTGKNFPEVFDAQGSCRGVLLFGPSDAGKTSLARSLPYEAGGAKLIACSPNFVMNRPMHPQSAATLIRQMFDDARVHKPCVMLMDEIELLAHPELNEAGKWAKKELIAQMRGETTLQPGYPESARKTINDNVMLVATTCSPWVLPDDLRRLFAYNIHIKLPMEKQREELFRMFLYNSVNNVTSDQYKCIISKSEGYSAADIRTVVRQASYNPPTQQNGEHHNHPRVLTFNDLASAMTNYRCLYKQEHLACYEKYIQEATLRTEDMREDKKKRPKGVKKFGKLIFKSLALAVISVMD